MMPMNGVMPFNSAQGVQSFGLPLPSQFQSPLSQPGPHVASRLMNNATGYFQSVPHLKESAVNILIPMSPALIGVRDLIPEMLLTGTQQKKQMVSNYQAKGISIMPSFTGHYLNLTVTGPTGKEPELVQAAFEILTGKTTFPPNAAPTATPFLEPGRLNMMKQDTAISARNMQSEPRVPLVDAMNKVLYGPNHPYALDALQASSVTQRQPLEQFVNTYVQALQYPERSKIVVTSPLAVEQQQALLNQAVQTFTWFASPYRQSQQFALPPVQQAPGIQNPVLVPNTSSQKAYITQIWRAPGVTDPDYPAFCVMRQILENLSGRFFKELRTNRGLVYGSQQAYSSDPQAGAYYSMNAEVENPNIIPALKGIQQVIQGLMQAPAPPIDMDMAKRKYDLWLGRALESPDAIYALNESMFTHEAQPLHPDDLKRRIAAVTPADVQRVANRIFNPAYGSELTGLTAPPEVLTQFTQTPYYRAFRDFNQRMMS